MKLHVNGEPEQTRARTVGELIEERGLADHAVAVEVNQRLVAKAKHAETPLNDGDHVELVTLVGGG